MRGITRVALLALAVGLGGCVFHTEGNIFSTESGDILPTSGKMQCQLYGDTGTAQGDPETVYVVSLKNGEKQQYLWINETWLKDPKKTEPFTVHHVSGDAFLMVSRRDEKPGQDVYALSVTPGTFEVRQYEKVQVMSVAQNFPIEVIEEKVGYSLKGDKEAQRGFLRELSKSAMGSRIIYGCVRTPQPSEDR